MLFLSGANTTTSIPMDKTPVKMSKDKCSEKRCIATNLSINAMNNARNLLEY
jgi:hypothetical protein